MQDDNKLLAPRFRNSAKLTKGQTIFLGALVGGISSFFMSAIFLSGFGFVFPVSYLLLIVALGASIGAIGTLIASHNYASRWVIIVVAIFIGLLIPICFIQSLFLLAGPD